MAVLRLFFLDSGMRLSELTNLKVGDLDLDARVAIVMEGASATCMPVRGQDGRGSSTDISIYGLGDSDAAQRATPCGSGCAGRWAPCIRALIERRQAGWPRRCPRPLVLPRLRPRLVEGRWQRDRPDLMRLVGWRSREMLGRYGASAAAERGRDCLPDPLAG